MPRAAPSASLSLLPATLREKVADIDAARLESIIERLVEATNPDAIILFGSRARGDSHRDSDFDLFVLVSETRPFGDKEPCWLWHLIKDLGLSVDVLIGQTAVFERRCNETNSLESAVQNDGIVVYERS